METALLQGVASRKERRKIDSGQGMGGSDGGTNGKLVADWHDTSIRFACRS